MVDMFKTFDTATAAWASYSDEYDPDDKSRALEEIQQDQWIHHLDSQPLGEWHIVSSESDDSLINFGSNSFVTARLISSIVEDAVSFCKSVCLWRGEYMWILRSELPSSGLIVITLGSYGSDIHLVGRV